MNDKIDVFTDSFPMLLIFDSDSYIAEYLTQIIRYLGMKAKIDTNDYIFSQQKVLIIDFQKNNKIGEN